MLNPGWQKKLAASWQQDRQQEKLKRI